MGDCTGAPHFTHISFDDYRIIRDNLAGANRTTTNRQVPSCTFIVDLDVAGRGGLDACQFQAHIAGVGGAASGYEEVGTFEEGASAEMQLYVCSGDAFDAGDGGAGDDVDAFVVEELLDGFRDVGVFAVGEGGVALDDGDAGAEATHGLSELEADVASADDEEMFGKDVEFEGFDVSERTRFEEAGDGFEGGAGAGGEEDFVDGEGAGASGVEIDLNPELAHVGLTETEAKKKGIPYRLTKLPMLAVLRTRTLSETRGFFKALIAEDDRILGFTALGTGAGEYLPVIQLAMASNLPYTAIRDLIIAHPPSAKVSSSSSTPSHHSKNKVRKIAKN
jgi:hypothetical protein